jgi:predicted ATPase
MILEELKIEGFRSLKSVTWRPGRLNVLIGPNGGGKSNLLSALDLLRVAPADSNLKSAVLRLGGMAALVWDGQAKEALLGLKTDSSLCCVLAMLRIGSSGGLQSELWGPRQRVSIEEMLTEIRERRQSHIPPETREIVGKFHRFLSSWSIHHDIRTDQGSDLRGATITRDEKRVESDGQNLIAVLHTLYENDRDFEEFLDKAMSAAFPNDYDKLVFPPEADGRTQLRVRRQHRKRADSSADLSDGTLRFLLLMAILGSPDPAPLIAIDEPETGLHPRMLPIIAEVAANAALKSQVIFTTHSPNLLDAFNDEVPTTTIVTSNGSETDLKTIGGEELKRWIDNYSFGKFAFSGEAEAVL